MPEETEATTATVDDPTKGFNCRVITPLSTVFEGVIKRIELQGVNGVFEILPRHEPMMAPLAIGIVIMDDKVGTKKFAVHGGFIEVNGDEIVILADAAEKADEIDLARAEEAMKRAKEHLEEVTGTGDEDIVDIDRAKLALMRAILRLSLKDGGI